MSFSLPIDALRPELEKAWEGHRNFILRAPTGSGKSTRVPRYLLEWAPFDRGRTIIVLQPRRMAARMLARRVAVEMGESPGETVGYQVRFESRRSAQTRLLFVTEGLLLRMLRSREALSGVGAILFDEFHERHLEGDIGLGLARAFQQSGWTGRIGVFSATLETRELAGYLPDAALLESEGRQYPVETGYCGGSQLPVWKRAARGFRHALEAGAKGDFLVFMPGKYEINRTLEELGNLRETRGYDLYPLHGELDAASQDRAVTPGTRPRIIVSTNVAETSLTLPGVRTVIDSGLARIPEFDARRGVNSLLTGKISRASAEQRAGRAGRIAPGHCVRLWLEKEQEHRPARILPEIERLDLAEIRLKLMTMGMEESFPWLTPPPQEAWERAGRLLEELGASYRGEITERGRKMQQYPLHPRISRILLEAIERRCVDLVTLAMALAEGRSVVLPLPDKRRAAQREEWWAAAEGFSDMLREVLVWQVVQDNGCTLAFCREWGIHQQALRQAERVFRQLKQVMGKVPEDARTSTGEFAKCLLTGYIDHLAVRLDRGTRRCRMVHGKGGELARGSLVGDAPMFIATDVEEREYRGEAVLFLGGATTVREEWLAEMFPDDYATTTIERMDPQRRRVLSLEQTVFRDLVLHEKEKGTADPANAARVLARAIHEEGWKLNKWNQQTEDWIRRLNVLARFCPELEISPIGKDDRLLLIEQISDGAVSYKEVKDRPVRKIVESWIPESLLPLVEEWVPERFPLPSGGRPKLRYEEDGTVVLLARIQQLYDVPGKSLRICQGKCPLKIEILAPNGRPVQITNDLDGFWTAQYPNIRKELYGRYPKHEWR